MKQPIKKPIHERIEIRGDCLVWTGPYDKDGYGSIKRGGRSMRIHRHIYELLYGPIPAGLVVRHTCDNPPCCNIAHLLLGTLADNNADKASRGRSYRGERVCWRKLTESNVVNIRTLKEAGSTLVELAAAFGVARSTISGVVYGKNWRHL